MFIACVMQLHNPRYLCRRQSLSHALQIARLPQLRRLRLETCSYSSSSLSRLLALSGSLTRLELAEMEDLSAEGGMAALTRLQHLLCWLGSPEAGEAIAAALPHLTGLTCLVREGHGDVGGKRRRDFVGRRAAKLFG